MTNQEIVSKLWNLCNILRDDGITYHQYVTELTYILFLKMAKETKTEDSIPQSYRWDKLVCHSGIELKKFYKELLSYLGENTKGRVREIYQGSSSNIDEPKNLEKIIKSIDDLDWYSAKEEGLGNLYEGLLEKNANEKKSGAGQYFTPRVLIDVMTRLVAPQVGERCNDPACGTFGFMISADSYVKSISDDYCDLTEKQVEFQVKEAFTGGELVHETHRLALMNAMLHNIDGKIVLGDTLSESGKAMTGYDVVLTNPPFGTKKGGERATRDDFTYTTSNKQLNFLQHIYRSLRTTGNARAAVVLPDNVLFEDNAGQKIRADLMNKCNLHTILRLPTGIFYAQGVKTNVLFFTRGKTDENNTKEVWVYDMRSNMRSFGKTNPLKTEDFAEFEELYCAGHFEDRKETWSEENPNGRWKKYTIEEILKDEKTSLDLKWIKDTSNDVNCTLSELMQIIEQKSANIAKAVSELKALTSSIDESEKDADETDKLALQPAVKQAKSKILDLAIHGKLVPQDPADEPAAVLLEKLRAEKEAKIAKGELKRDKNDSYIYKSTTDNCHYEKFADGTEEEIEVPFELPNNWSWCHFGDIADVINGKNQSKVVDDNGLYPIYGSGGIMGRANDYICHENCTIIGRKGSINNPIFVEEKFWNVDTAFGLAPTSSVLPKYLFYFCKSFDFTTLDSSTTLPSLTKTSIQQILFPLPSLPEQQRIINKIENLFEYLDQIILNLV